jgi:hypothetical protein
MLKRGLVVAVDLMCLHFGEEIYNVVLTLLQKVILSCMTNQPVQRT